MRLRKQQIVAFSGGNMVVSVRLGVVMDTKKIERISKALADETRLRIYEAIAIQKNLTCSELVKLQGVTPATISHHLKILTDAELIECRKEGQFVYSRTVPETIAEFTESLARIAKGHHTVRIRTKK
jgi:ArsR family transcriptional regulator